jgi:hypothetical protein
MTRKHRRLTKKQREEKAITWAIVIGVILFGFIYLVNLIEPHLPKIGLVIGIIVALVVVTFILLRVLKYLRKLKVQSEIHDYLLKALEKMDTTGRYYNDEGEANRELATALKVLGINATYEHILPDRRRADIKVGDIIIEGKLSPNMDEVDRLLGQVQGYCSRGYKVNIVIYGRLEDEYRKRIENEILERYEKRVFLTFLPNPKRMRVN